MKKFLGSIGLVATFTFISCKENASQRSVPAYLESGITLPADLETRELELVSENCKAGSNWKERVKKLNSSVVSLLHDADQSETLELKEKHIMAAGRASQAEAKILDQVADCPTSKKLALAAGSSTSIRSHAKQLGATIARALVAYQKIQIKLVELNNRIQVAKGNNRQLLMRDLQKLLKSQKADMNMMIKMLKSQNTLLRDVIRNIG